MTTTQTIEERTMKAKKPLSFQKLHDRLPMALVASDDPWQVKTIDDLAFLAQHELDLHDEGEIELTARDRKSIQKFLDLCRANR